MFDLAELEIAVRRHGKVARLVIAEIHGSSPREVGAAMLVWQDPCDASGQSGSIGGGALEFQAVTHARMQLDHGPAHRLERIALGPALGQCCGGAIRLLTEIYDAKALAGLRDDMLIARPVASDAPQTRPFGLKRLIADLRSKGTPPQPRLLQGWMIEPLAQPLRQIWIWGAGHVGRALIHTLAPLPDLALTWIDTDRARFPPTIPPEVTPVWSAHPEALCAHAPATAEHLILTYSHALDLELCHRLLGQPHRSIGLIGSATKWARFGARLRNLGHCDKKIGQIHCPIGDPGLGKHPQAIAVGVAVHLLRRKPKSETEIADDIWHDDGSKNTTRDLGPDQDLPRRGGQ